MVFCIFRLKGNYLCHDSCTVEIGFKTVPRFFPSRTDRKRWTLSYYFGHRTEHNIFCSRDTFDTRTHAQKHLFSVPFCMQKIFYKWKFAFRSKNDSQYNRITEMKVNFYTSCSMDSFKNFQNKSKKQYFAYKLLQRCLKSHYLWWRQQKMSKNVNFCPK